MIYEIAKHENRAAMGRQRSCIYMVLRTRQASFGGATHMYGFILPLRRSVGRRPSSRTFIVPGTYAPGNVVLEPKP